MEHTQTTSRTGKCKKQAQHKSMSICTLQVLTFGTGHQYQCGVALHGNTQQQWDDLIASQWVGKCGGWGLVQGRWTRMCGRRSGRHGRCGMLGETAGWVWVGMRCRPQPATLHEPPLVHQSNGALPRESCCRHGSLCDTHRKLVPSIRRSIQLLLVMHGLAFAFKAKFRTIPYTTTSSHAPDGISAVH